MYISIVYSMYIYIILFSGLKFYLENYLNQKLNDVENIYWHGFKLYINDQRFLKRNIYYKNR